MTNQGDADADSTGVVLTETVPDGTTYDNVNSTFGWDCGGQVVEGSVCTFEVGDLLIGSSAPTTFFAVEINNPTTVAEVENTVAVDDDGASGADNNPFDNEAFDSTTVNVPCNGTEDLVLTSPSGETTIVHEACNSIVASYTITSGRDVTFKARNLIVLQDGFSVETGAIFTAENDPLAGQNPP